MLIVLHPSPRRYKTLKTFMSRVINFVCKRDSEGQPVFGLSVYIPFPLNLLGFHGVPLMFKSLF